MSLGIDPDEFTPAMSWRCPEGHKLRPDRKRMSWHGNSREKVDATHFIAPPLKPDPFEAWWGSAGLPRVHKHDARTVWNAAREANP